MIPDERKAAVENALRAGLGNTELQSIEQISIGLSTALTYKIYVADKPYLMRITTRTDAVSDPTHYYKCMQPASEAGIAPPVFYAGIEDRISITGYIEARPFSQPDARKLLPALLKRLHAMPAFPYRINYIEVAKRAVERYRASNVMPEGCGKVFADFGEIMQVYPVSTTDWVSCHNDLKKDNILFDGQQVWLVDWEAAFLNDRFVDLAAISNFIITNPDEEIHFLREYFGREPLPVERAKFFLMQQLIHLFCFVLCASIASPAQAPDFNMITRSFRDFHNGLWAGAIDLGTRDNKIEYALVHLQQFILNTSLPRFEESLGLLQQLKP